MIQLHWIVSLPYFTVVEQVSPFLANLMKLGWCGVDIFFVVSGFLIGGLLMDQRDSPNRAGVFFARRVLRIFPIYYLLLTILALLPATRSFSTLRDVPLWAFYGFIQNLFTSLVGRAPGAFGPLWSIAIEEQFYLVVPLVIWLASRRARAVILVAAMILPLSLRLLLAAEVLTFKLSWWDFTLARIDGLAFGVFGAWIIRQPNWRARLSGARRSHRVILLLLTIGTVGLSQFSRLEGGRSIQNTIGICYLNFFFLVALLYLVLHTVDSRLAKLMRFSPIRATGRVSYFLYLFHLPSLYVALHLGLRSFWAVLPTAAFCLGISAWASWRSIEGPLIALGRRLRYKPRPGDETISAPRFVSET